jgi:hypothetical protein
MTEPLYMRLGPWYPGRREWPDFVAGTRAAAADDARRGRPVAALGDEDTPTPRTLAWWAGYAWWLDHTPRVREIFAEAFWTGEGAVPDA